MPLLLPTGCASLLHSAVQQPVVQGRRRRVPHAALLAPALRRGEEREPRAQALRAADPLLRIDIPPLPSPCRRTLLSVPPGLRRSGMAAASPGSESGSQGARALQLPCPSHGVPAFFAAACWSSTTRGAATHHVSHAKPYLSHQESGLRAGAQSLEGPYLHKTIFSYVGSRVPTPERSDRCC